MKRKEILRRLVAIEDDIYRGQERDQIKVEMRQEHIRNLKNRWIVFCFIVALLIIGAAGYVTYTDYESTAPYTANDSVSRIVDTENLLSAEDKMNLITETEKTDGSIYKIIFFVDGSNKKTMEKSYSSVSSAMWNSRTPSKYVGYHYDLTTDVFVIVYNAKLDEYVFMPKRTFLKNDNIFKLIDATRLDNGSSYIPYNMAKTFTERYSDLIGNTPAETYKNVFEWLTINGYTEEQVQERLDEMFKKDRNSDTWSAIGGCTFGCVILFSIMTALTWSSANNAYLPERKNKLIDDCYEKATMKINKLKDYQAAQQAEIDRKNAEQQEKARQAECQREIDEETARLRREESEHPFRKLIEATSQIVSTNKTINERRDVVLNLLKIAESVYVIQTKEENPAAHRFQIHYLNMFQDNIDDILFHAKKHSTQFDTEEELPILNRTFNVYEKILQKYIDESEREGTQNIEINLNVLEQLAGMDGYSD